MTAIPSYLPAIDGAAIQRGIVALTVVNAGVLGLETSATAMEFAGAVLEAIDTAIMAVFVVELGAKIAVQRSRFAKDPWNLFDLTVVSIGLVPGAQSVSVLRALRVLRVLRLVSGITGMRRVVDGLVASLPGMAAVSGLLSLLFYTFGVMATMLFGQAFPDWFGTLGRSMYSLFQIMTLESWSMGIVRPVMEVYPYAWAFFVPFILMTAFAVMNLFVAVVVSAMQQQEGD